MSLFHLGRGRPELWRLTLPARVPTSRGNFVIQFVHSVYTHLCLPYIIVPALRGSRHLLIQKPWGNPYQSSGLTFSSAQNTKAMQICPACVYLLSVSVCTTGTSIVPCVAIIACNLHRIRTGNSALISNKAGKSLYRLGSYLTAQQNYRFSCGVLNLQGVFYFWCAGNTISSECCLFICLVCFITQL